MPKKGKISDEDLADLGRRRKKAMELEAKFKKRKDRLSQKIGQELKVRKTRLMENSGVRITWTKQTRTVYDYYGILGDLTELVGRREARKIMNKVRPHAIDAAALFRVMQDGDIPEEIVQKNSSVVTHAEYPTITLVEDVERD